MLIYFVMMKTKLLITKLPISDFLITSFRPNERINPKRIDAQKLGRDLGNSFFSQLEFY